MRNLPTPILNAALPMRDELAVAYDCFHAAWQKGYTREHLGRIPEIVRLLRWQKPIPPAMARHPSYAGKTAEAIATQLEGRAKMLRAGLGRRR